jgi:hypothetical protein
MRSQIQRRSQGWVNQSAPSTLADRRSADNPYKIGTGHHPAQEAAGFYRRDFMLDRLPFKIDDVRGTERERFGLLV